MSTSPDIAIGTGMSSTITARTLAGIGGPAEQAAFLKLFRADSIGKLYGPLHRCQVIDKPTVNDCESVRKTLTTDYPEEKKKWSVMGQSFGGFCAVNYLSRQ